MTMPDERTRALRFGWEFLLDLRDEPSLTAEQRLSVDEILLHYPSGAEIKQWAQDWEQDVDPLCGLNLAPEPSRAVGQTSRVYQDAIERGPTAPQERMRAICQAYSSSGLGCCGGAWTTCLGGSGGNCRMCCGIFRRSLLRSDGQRTMQGSSKAIRGAGSGWRRSDERPTISRCQLPTFSDPAHMARHPRGATISDSLAWRSPQSAHWSRDV